MNPPYDYDVHPDDVCMMCLVNICGLCETDECVCGHGLTWPAVSPWDALMHFGPGTLGYAAAMALTAVHEQFPIKREET